MRDFCDGRFFNSDSDENCVRAELLRPTSGWFATMPLVQLSHVHWHAHAPLKGHQEFPFYR